MCAVYYIYHPSKAEDENLVSQASEELPNKTFNLRLGISNLDSLNPIISKNQNIQDISKLIFEPLFDLDDSFKLKGMLGLEVSKANSKTYLVTLRENVKWHNGSNFSAQDVKFTIDTIKNLGENSIYISNVSNIENIEIIGQNLIKIYLYEEEPFFEYNLTFPIISSNFFEGVEDITQNEKNNLPMGTGKYKLYSIDPNTQMDLKLNDYWWNKDVELKVDSITVRIYRTVAEVYNAYKLRRSRFNY